MSTQHKKLQDAFVQALGFPKETDFAKLAYGKNPLWDSIAHMRLVSHIESSFEIMLDTEDVIAMSTYSEAVAIVKKHGVAFDA